MERSKIWPFVPDMHYPETDKKALAGLFHFLEENPVEGIILGGDQHSNDEISHHNRKKIIFREPGAYHRNTVGFDKEVLTPLEERVTRLNKKVRKVWINGNHERFVTDLTDANPELLGSVERDRLLHLEERGWEVLCLGKGLKLGKLLVIHGEPLTGIGNQAGQYPAKSAVDRYAQSVLFGHVHTMQSFTRVLPHDKSQKWAAWSSPVLAKTNPAYAQNKPNAVVQGFTIVEQHGAGLFNVFPIVMVNGSFAFGGKVYGKRKVSSRKATD